MPIFLAISAGFAVVAGISFFFPNPEYLIDIYDRSQKLYSKEEYQKAIEGYEHIVNINSAVLKEEMVTRPIGAYECPIQMSSSYMLANAFQKLVEKNLSNDSLKNDYFKRALHYYQIVKAGVENKEVKAQTQFQIVKANASAQYHPGTIASGYQMLAEFPKNDFVDDVLYEMGWGYYNLERYDSAAVIFQKLVDFDPQGFRADKSRLQIGLCYKMAKNFPVAIQSLTNFINIYKDSLLTIANLDIGRRNVSQAQGQAYESKIELLVDAQALIGDCYLEMADLKQAIRAYKVLTSSIFPRENFITETAYLRIADAYYKSGDLKSSIGAYKEAIDYISSSERPFKAKMQYLVTLKYFNEKMYEEAIREYEHYIKAYEDVAEEANFGVDRAYYQIAECYLKLSQYKQAIQQYRKIIANFAQSKILIETEYGLGLAYEQDHQLDAAIQTYLGIAKKYGTNIVVAYSLLQVARIFNKQDKLDEAIEQYQRMIDDFPDYEEIDQVSVELGQAYRKNKNLDKALIILGKVPKTSEFYDNAGLEISEIYVVQKKFNDAKEILRTVLAVVKSVQDSIPVRYGIARVFLAAEEYSGAIEEFNYLIQHSRKIDEKIFFNALFGRASSFHKSKKYAKAIADLEILLSQKEVSKSLIIPSQRLLGRCYLDDGQEAKALALYLKLVKSSKDEEEKAEYLLLISEVYRRTKQWEKAIRQTEDVLVLKLENKKTEQGYYIKERTYFILGQTYLDMKKYDQAITTFEKCIREYPESFFTSNCHFLIGVANFESQKFDKAIKHFEEFSQKFKKDDNFEFSLYYLAYSYFSLNDFPKAADLFERIAERYPEFERAAEAQFKAGESYFQDSQFKTAVASYLKVKKNFHNSEFTDDAAYNIIWCYSEQKEDKKFLQSLQEFMREFSESEFASNVQITLGDVYFNDKQYEKAIEEYQRVIDRYVGSEYVGKAKELVAETKEVLAFQFHEKAMVVFDQAVQKENDADLFKKSVDLFKVVEQKYKDTETAAGSLCNMGVCYEYLHEWDKALAIYSDIVNFYTDKKNCQQAVIFARDHKRWIEANRM